jgi:hypothetical protein
MVYFPKLTMFFFILGRWLKKKLQRSWAPVAHTCNPSYSGDRDQEDCGLKPVRANSLRKPVSKKPVTEKGLVEWLKV